ncbi:MAG: NADH-quinone oxidoreductase subunit J [Verrucomicrobiota bacterium]
MAEQIFFNVFSLIALVSAVLVVVNKNPVNAAMFLIVSFLGLASLFVMLEAYFLAVIQVLVYAGAVVVLFLFIIMLLDVKEAASKKVFTPITIASGAIGGAILILGIALIRSSETLDRSKEDAIGLDVDPLKEFGNQLFTTYLLPMQVTGFLLLIAMIGVIVLSKKFEKEGA